MSFKMLLISVCNAGYYKTGSSCELCTGNKIKSSKGDAADCDTDTVCDGVSTVPNTDHTACSKSTAISCSLMIRGTCDFKF